VPHLSRTPFRVDPKLQAFRGETRASASLHPLEKALLVITGAQLVFTPWALGTMHVWSQGISLGLAIAGFVVALINRHYTEEHAHEGDFKLIMWPKLVRFPLFWLGLGLLVYMLVQALNPAWIYAVNGGLPWLVPIDHLSWLPTGIEGPFSLMNAWRTLMIYGAAWLLVCALWVGITRRSALQHLLTLIVANGAILALLGILERVTGTYQILWFVSNSAPGSFFATFIYKNHAGAYFNLVFMLCVALAYWHFARGERRLERSNPAPVFAFFSAVIGVGVLLTFSRAATLLLIVFTLIAFISFFIRCSLTRGEGRNPIVMGMLCAMFAIFVGLGAYSLNLDKSFNRLGKLMREGQTDFSISSRQTVLKAAWDMAEDNLVTGWGAGSFRYMFPAYQRNYPAIYLVPEHSNVRMGWQYAHNDYVQWLDECGLIGAAFFLAMLACGIRHLWRNRVHQRPHLMFLVLALFVTLAHGWMDFPSHNPAILFLWCGIAVLTGRWAEMENRKG
jgi:O-antigen ligase